MKPHVILASVSVDVYLKRVDFSMFDWPFHFSHVSTDFFISLIFAPCFSNGEKWHLVIYHFNLLVD